ncbi:hypothetical protein [Pseudoalteromonas rhizosphaerae]|uniref:hypothetical protein n=1 Tax=Pseudoalteromonas rhizosphaerae TaxID=2518973 RepID=UPI00384D9F2E
MQDISTSWKYDLLLPDSAIEGMQAMVKQLDEVTPQIDQGVRNAAQEIGNRVNKALDEFEPPASTGVVGKPKKTVANELEAPKGNDLKGATSKNRKFGPMEGEIEPSWGNLLRKHGAGEPPESMINPHAHHSIFKKGRGKKMIEYLDESKDIVEKYDIDWYKGPENLGWAPNKNHSTKAAKAVRDYLVKVEQNSPSRESIIKALQEIKEHFANDTIHTLY